MKESGCGIKCSVLPRAWKRKRPGGEGPREWRKKKKGLGVGGRDRGGPPGKGGKKQAEQKGIGQEKGAQGTEQGRGETLTLPGNLFSQKGAGVENFFTRFGRRPANWGCKVKERVATTKGRGKKGSSYLP